MAKKNFGKDGFRKIYYETLNEKIQDGMASYSKKRMFNHSAFERGYDSKEVSK
jgi:hypothetical protein